MKKYLIILLSFLFVGQANAAGVLGIDPFHPIQSAKRVAVGYVVAEAVVGLTTGGIIAYLMAHPEKLGDWISNNPNEVPKVNSLIDKKIKESKTLEEREKYIKLKNDIALTQDAYEATFIEHNNMWQAMYSQIEAKINAKELEIEQSGKMPQCNLTYLAQMLEDTEMFHNGIHLTLPYKLSTPAKSPDASSYKVLVANYKADKNPNKTELQQDHIPSFAALDDFFNNHGYQTKTVTKINKNGVPVVKRDKSLENNAAAIAVPLEIHKLGRTFAGKNRFLHENDAKDLKLATIKDITTTAFYVAINPQYNISSDDYIDSGIRLFERNKLLCMYDVQ